MKVEKPARNFVEKIPGTEMKLEMVYIPGGEFLMGSDPSEPGHQVNEGPQHRVKVKPFWLGKTEVTWDHFQEYTSSTELFHDTDVPKAFVALKTPDAITKPTVSYIDETYGHGVKGYPALCMTHHSAMMYCHWLRWKTGLGYRLPTEAEWEFAARAGHSGKFGYDEKTEKIGDHAWYAGNSATENYPDGTTHRVGTKKANAFGLHDMSGNVSEWCLDQYDPDAYLRFTGKLSLGAVVPPTDAKWSHVVRGGSWADKTNQLRPATRRVSDKTWQKYDPELPQSIWWLTMKDSVGFRVCLPVEEYPELHDLKPRVQKRIN